MISNLTQVIVYGVVSFYYLKANLNECQVESKEDIELNNKLQILILKEKELNNEVDELEQNYQTKVSELLILTKLVNFYFILALSNKIRYTKSF